MALSAGEIEAVLRLDISPFLAATSTARAQAQQTGAAIASGMSSGAAGATSLGQATSSLANQLAAIQAAQRALTGATTGSTAATQSNATAQQAAANAARAATTATQGNTTAASANAAAQQAAAQQRAAQQASLQNLARTLDQVTGAVTQQTRAFLANEIGPEQLRGIEALGVSTEDYINAAAGVPGAEARVRAALAASSASAADQATTLNNLAQTQQRVSTAQGNVTTTARATGAAQHAAAQAAQQQAQAQQQVATNSNSAMDSLKKLGGVLAGAASVAYLQSAVEAASDLNEVVSKSNNIFGEGAEEVMAWSETAASSVGLSKGAALDAAAGFGNMFTQIGFTDQAAAKLSTSTVQLAADLGSFNNQDTAEVADKIKGAMNGEYDSLQQLIPSINAAAVETEALAASGKKSAAELSTQEKAQAVLSIVTRDGAKAAGDFAETSSGYANQLKIASAEAENAKVAIGEALMPTVLTLLQLFRDVGVPAIQGFGDGFQAVFEVIGPFVSLLGTLVKGFFDLPAPILTAIVTFTAFSLLSGPMAGLTISMAGVTAAATRLGVALKGIFLNPLGIAITAVVTAFSLFSSSADEATVPVTSFTAAIDESTGALKENAAATVAKALADSGSINAMQEIGVSAEVYTRAIMGNKDAIDQVNAAIAAGTTSYYTAEFGELTTTTEAASAAAATFAADTGNLSAEQDKARDAAEGAKAAIAAEGEAAAATTGPVAELATALGDGKDAATEMSDAVSILQAALTILAGGTVAEAEAQRNHEATIRSVAAAARDLAEAQITVSEKQTALTELQNSGSASAADLAAAQRDLDEAVAAAADAADGQAESLDSLATSAQAMTARSFEGAGGMKNFDSAVAAASATMVTQRQRFIDSAIAAGTGKEAAEALADAQGLIPADVKTAYEAIRAKEAKDAATGVGDAVKDIPKNSSTTLSADDRATSILTTVRSKLDGIDGSTATATVKVIQSIAQSTQNLIDTLNPFKRATGGAVFGPGTTTSDSIPALLSNNEHVWTAAEVEAIGGHDRMERMRKMALSGAFREFSPAQPSLRLATGGPVTYAASVASSGTMAGGFASSDIDRLIFAINSAGLGKTQLAEHLLIEGDKTDGVGGLSRALARMPRI